MQCIVLACPPAHTCSHSSCACTVVEHVLRYAVHWAPGNPQPAYKLEGMKIIMEFPKPKNPEEAGAMPEVERKQVRAYSSWWFLQVGATVLLQVSVTPGLQGPGSAA